jgi:transcription termination/antitermination protein NusG
LVQLTKQWYVIHTQTGHEERVKTTLEGRAQQFSMQEKITQVLIPTEKVSEIKAVKKKITTRKFFPGYVLVEMELNDDTWYLVKNTPGVSGFIGSGRRPLPLKESEVATIIKQAEEKKEKPTPKVIFEKGESIRVKEGPFINFNGTIEEVNPNKGKLKVMVAIFGRTTPVELEYWQVEKI